MDTDFSFVLNAAPPVILVVSLNGFGWALKFVPKLPNYIIPLALPIAGALLWPLIGDYSPVILKAKMPTVLMGLYGFGLGWVAVGANQTLRKLMEHFGPETPEPPTSTPPAPPTT